MARCYWFCCYVLGRTRLNYLNLGRRLLRKATVTSPLQTIEIIRTFLLRTTFDFKLYLPHSIFFLKAIIRWILRYKHLNPLFCPSEFCSNRLQMQPMIGYLNFKIVDIVEEPGCQLQIFFFRFLLFASIYVSFCPAFFLISFAFLCSVDKSNTAAISSLVKQ